MYSNLTCCFHRLFMPAWVSIAFLLLWACFEASFAHAQMQHNATSMHTGHTSSPASMSNATTPEQDPHAAHRMQNDMPTPIPPADKTTGADSTSPTVPPTANTPSLTDELAKNLPVINAAQNNASASGTELSLDKIKQLQNSKSAPPPPDFIEKLGDTVPSGILLQDETGKSIDVTTLLDIPTVIVPIFFTCPAACNTLQSSIAATITQVNLTPGKDFRVIVISFDENDTPEMAARKKANYLAAMNYTFPANEFRYLTGNLQSIKQFMGAIGFPFIRLGVGNFSHPVGIVILAPGGKVTRYLYGQGFMPFDITMALHEAAEGKTGLSIKRIVTYCFSYDPASKKYVFDVIRFAGGIILFGIGIFIITLLFGGKKKKPQQQ